MPLTTGSRLGPYEVESLLGAGGMGTVYRARDTRLNRSVAIKVLSDVHAGDTAFRARFEREARTIASLNHPHICTVYDVGRHEEHDYLVLELIEGTTLAAKLERQPLDLDEALAYGIQIADALDRAHRAGIVHRDLKPGNIMVTRTGIKLLDFGLAKASEPAASGLAALSTSPANATAPGTILGTLQYMAPEQIEGGDIDARTDIFAFGAVLYEMVTGRKAFEGKNAARLMGAILRDTPPAIDTMQPRAPRSLDRIVSACLAKEPGDRWQSARDVRRELEWIVEGAAASPAPTDLRPAAPGARYGFVAALVAVAAIAGIGVGWATRSSPPSPAVARWSFPTAAIGASSRVAISRDAQAIVYEGLRPDGVQQLFARRVDQLDAAAIRGTEGASQLALSPDASWVLFVLGRRLLKVPFGGGPVAGVADVPANIAGLSWGARDEIVFGSTEGLFRVSAAGGTPVALTHVDTANKETAHGWPTILADGRTVLFVVSRAAIPEIAVTSLAGEAPRPLVRGTHPRMTADGDLLFTRGSTVWATKYDAGFTRVEREPTPVLEGVHSLLSGYSAFDVAPDGTLVYRPRRPESHQLSWIERSGRTTPATTEKFDGIYHGPPALSADGHRLAVSRHPTNGVDQIAIYDLDRNIQRALAGVSGTSRWPVWTPDGAHLTFASEREGSWDIFEAPASAPGSAEPLLVAPDDQLPWSWAPDGTLGYVSGRLNVFDIFFLPRGGKPYPLSALAGSHTPITRLEASVAFSPNGKWIAYESDESGRMEVYLRAFPDARDAVQISVEGGRYPLWSRKGNEIFFISGQDRVMSVSTSQSQTPSTPVELFRTQFGNDGSRPYDVGPDGRFIAIQDLNTTPASIVVVQHWTADLGRRSATR